MLELSRALVAQEVDGVQAPTARARDVCEKLRPTLSTLMGATGFRALLSRALALASTEVPALGQLEIDASGSLVYRAAISAEANRINDTEGDVVLVAQLLSLLVAFIGENLTRQLLLDVWPQSLAHGSNLQTGDSE
jgi:hypothetical protein